MGNLADELCYTSMKLVSENKRYGINVVVFTRHICVIFEANHDVRYINLNLPILNCYLKK